MSVPDRSIYRGFIRLHILYHACKEPIFGAGISDELGRHGYRVSAGTLYPMLHGLEQEGLLRASHQRDGRRYRRVYRATASGRRALASAKVKVRELFAELFEEDWR
jgi:DNA-binding PadR family transcriptional regulator